MLFKNDFFIKEENSDIPRQVSIPDQEKLILSSEKDVSETHIQRYFIKTKRKNSKEINGTKGKNDLKPVLKNNKKNNRRSIEPEENNTKIQFIENNNIIDNNKIKVKEKEEENSSNEDNDKKFNDLYYFNDSLDYFSDNKEDSAKDWSIPKLEELNNDDDIIMCSTYIPFNPVREKDGKINFVLTNESIYLKKFNRIRKKRNYRKIKKIEYIYIRHRRINLPQSHATYRGSIRAFISLHSFRVRYNARL